MRLGLTHNRLYLLVTLLRPEDRQGYLARIEASDDPLGEALRSGACAWCGMPRVFGCCTALCRCPECRRQGEFVQLQLPIVGGVRG
ncbi:MAG TPA: hypothetical protein VEY08_16165 [Chloroflexia bacterium]|nr:hypothetical protein [Chloroflexia bacterium]